MKKLYLLLIVVAFGALLTGCSKNNLGGAPFTSFQRSGVVAVGTASTSVLTTNTARSYALITNDSDTVVYLQLGTPLHKVSSGYTVRLSASGGTYEISDKNLYLGPIYASSSVAAKKILYLEN